MRVNEVAALALIDRNKFSLAASSLEGKEANLFKNWKILASDVDKFIPVNVDGTLRRYYINDNDTFVNRSTLSIKDGDYFDMSVRGGLKRLFV